MFKFKIIPDNINFNFLKFKYIAFMFSFILISITMIFLFFKGLNFGIDFKGGTLIELKSKNNQAVDLAKFRERAFLLKAGEISVQKFGKNTDVLLRIQKQDGDNNKQIEIIEKAKKIFEEDFLFRRTEFVGPVVGDELKNAGITAVLLALFLIMIYIWFRFEWQFSIAAIVALTHDVITTIGLFSVFNLEFNLAIVAAILTTAGYSINDTVVVFDRVRENLRKYKSQDHYYIYNKSINETLSRTIITSATTLLALLAIYFFGGEILKGFSLAMILGVVFGTYSSIYIANTVLVRLRVSQKTVLREDEKN